MQFNYYLELLYDHCFHLPAQAQTDFLTFSLEDTTYLTLQPSQMVDLAGGVNVLFASSGQS